MFQGIVLLELRLQPLLLYPKFSHPFPFYQDDKSANFERRRPPGGKCRSICLRRAVPVRRTHLEVYCVLFRTVRGSPQGLGGWGPPRGVPKQCSKEVFTVIPSATLHKTRLQAIWWRELQWLKLQDAPSSVLHAQRFFPTLERQGDLRPST